jgi:hypothetical protein
MQMNTSIGSRLVLVGLLGLGGPAAAATFSVNITADLVDLIPGNGFCNVQVMAGPGLCSLRAAIIEANALPGPDVIVLQADQSYGLTIAGAGEDNAYTGDLDITDDVQVRFLASGERPIVNAGGIDRVFDLISGSVTLLGFDIVGGNATSVGTTSGGGVLVHSSAGTVNFSLMRVRSNTAQLGGGLFNFGTDTRVNASEFSANIFLGDINETSSGSAIRNRGTLLVGYSSFFHNSGQPLKQIGTIAGLTSSANTIDNEPQGALIGSLTMFNSTLVGNIGNAINMEGAGILTLSNVTIAGNSVRGVRVAGDGGNVHLRDSVVARNTFADCFLSTGASLSLDRYNMDSDDSCGLGAGSSNFPGVDPRLSPLARHGGFTLVSWPLSISPLLEHGHSVIGAIGCEDDDQHFTARPIDFDGNGTARCDIGAVELSDDVIFFYPFEEL